MPLPPEWVEKKSKSRKGRTFFYNKLTKKTQWEQPPMAIEDEEYPELNLDVSQESEPACSIDPYLEELNSRLNTPKEDKKSSKRRREQSPLLTRPDKKKLAAAILNKPSHDTPVKCTRVETNPTSKSSNLRNESKDTHTPILATLVTPPPPQTKSQDKPHTTESKSLPPKCSTSKSIQQSRSFTHTFTPKSSRPDSIKFIDTWNSTWNNSKKVEESEENDIKTEFATPKSVTTKSKKAKAEASSPNSVTSKSALSKSVASRSAPSKQTPIIKALPQKPNSETALNSKQKKKLEALIQEKSFKIKKKIRDSPYIKEKSNSKPFASTSQPALQSSDLTKPSISLKSALSEPMVVEATESSSSDHPEPEYMEVDVPSEDALSSVSILRSSNVGKRECIEFDSGTDKGGSAVINGVVVIDTNVLISHFKWVQTLLAQTTGQYLVIPWIVIQELDGLKECEKSDVASAARQSIRYLLQEKRGGNVRLKFEPSHNSPYSETPDDRVLGCLHWAKRIFNSGQAILLSNDNNLCLKALIHSYESFTVTDYQAELTMNGRFVRHTSTGSSDEEKVYRRRGPHAARRTKPQAPAQSAQSAQPQFLSKVVSHQKLELTRPPRDIQFTRPPRDIQFTRPPRDMEVPSRRISVPDIAEQQSPQSPQSPFTPPSAVARRVDQRLAHFSGGTVSPPTPTADVARKDKPILQVLDEMSASMLVFRQQVLNFSESQINKAGTAGHVSELTDLQTFLSQLIPDVLRIIEACQSISNVKITEMKQNFSVVMDMVSAIQVFTVHHLKYAPNVSPLDLYNWIIVADNLEILAVSKRHFCDLLNEIQNAVDAMLSSKVYTV